MFWLDHRYIHEYLEFYKNSPRVADEEIRIDFEKAQERIRK